MLQFFRKYQKFFFAIIAVAVIVSFAFFGTYQAIAPSFKKKEKDELVFKSLDGQKIFRSYLNQFNRFIDSENIGVSRGLSAYQFLNDGIFLNDFLKTGMAEKIILGNLGDYASSFQERWEREKQYRPYRHPYSSHLNAESAWNYFAPQILEALKKVQNIQNPLDTESVQARMALFFAEREFPPSLLAQVLRYQEKEIASLPADSRLWRDDLSLFGYRSLSDWFGPELIEAVSKCIIQGASLARQRGYKVTKEEALSELHARAQKAYEAGKDKMPCKGAHSFFQICLRQEGADEAAVTRMWQDIMLYRRMMLDVGNIGFADDFSLSRFFSCAYEHATVELYQLPKPFRFNDYRSLCLFEAYLYSIAGERKNSLSLPEVPFSLEEIKSRAPELVGRYYSVEVSKVEKKDLLSWVGLKEMWDWQIADSNWEELAKQFPQLKECKERFQTLESLPSSARQSIDAYSKNQIANSHPEWLEEILQACPSENKRFFSNKKDMEKKFPGIPYDSLTSALEEKKVFNAYNSDGSIYYRILCTEVSDETFLSFEDALSIGNLDEIADHCDPSLFQGTLNGVMEYLRKENKIDERKTTEELKDFCASYRLYPFMREYPVDLECGSIASQWKLQKRVLTVSRADMGFLSAEEIFSMEEPVFSKVICHPGQGLYFYRILDRKMNTSLPVDKFLKINQMIAQEARSAFFDQVLELPHISHQRCEKYGVIR